MASGTCGSNGVLAFVVEVHLACTSQRPSGTILMRPLWRVRAFSHGLMGGAVYPP